jgi:hypothetical protein
MPIHDWNRVGAGVFHHFHVMWTAEIAAALNGGILPPRYLALAEQSISGPIPDVITLEKRQDFDLRDRGGLMVADAPPKATYVISAEADVYAMKANRITIQHELGDVVAVIEIISPGNKSSGHAIRSFARKAEELLSFGTHFLIVDLFPPTPRDPQGLHKVIWDVVQPEPFELPYDKRLTVAAYSASIPLTAYVEPVAVGDSLPSLPIFLSDGLYIPAPLESTYQSALAKCPESLRDKLSHS